MHIPGGQGIFKNKNKQGKNTKLGKALEKIYEDDILQEKGKKMDFVQLNKQIVYQIEQKKQRRNMKNLKKE